MNNIDMLVKQVKEIGLLTGDFVLSSGRRSTYYLDKYLIETRPEILSRIAAEMEQKIPPETQLLAGPELGAIPLVTAVALRTGLPFVMVRKKAKEYGTKNVVEGLYHEGQKVVVIEDVLTTGTQVVNAARSLEGLGLNVLKIVCLIDREEGAREAIEVAGFTYDHLITRTMLGL